MPENGANSTSATEMEFNVLLEEYRTSTSEIRQRLHNQHTILTLVVSIIGGVTALIQILGQMIGASSLTPVIQMLHPVSAIRALLFIALAFMSIERDAVNGHFGEYIQT